MPAWMTNNGNEICKFKTHERKLIMISIDADNTAVKILASKFLSVTESQNIVDCRGSLPWDIWHKRMYLLTK